MKKGRFSGTFCITVGTNGCFLTINVDNTDKITI